jgi:hypothetical protein
MQISTMNAAAPISAAGTDGVPVMRIDGADRLRGTSAPMRVFTRENVGRFSGYGSLNTALSAARNLSRGSDRSAVVVQQRHGGGYEVLDAVWQYLHGTNNPPSDRAPFRHFHFEDGSLSQYTAWQAGEKIEVRAENSGRSYDGVTRWLVDGSRVAEVDHVGGKLF